MYKIIFATIFALLSINLTACSESGCPEGQREYAGNCVDINDGDKPDGDYPDLVFLDGDSGGGGGDNPVIDGDQEENTITGSGRCGSPFVHNVSDRSTALNGHGDISLMSAIISGQSCKPLGGTDEDSLGLGPEVVVKIFLYPSDTITLSFNGDGFDAIMYVLLGACADSDQTNCGLQTINQFGMGQGEQVVFSPPAQGEYFVVMDTLATSATGAYYYKIEIAEGVDGDQDQTDGDIDGDTDSDSDTVSETDTEQIEQDQMEADKEEASVPEFYNVIVGGYSIPDDENVTGNFSDLYWQGSQVHLMADTGLAYWTYVSNNFDGDPTFTETPDKVIKGVSYRSAIRAELDQTIRLIGPTPHGNIQFPSNFSPKASGLAYYNEEYYALDQENNRIFIYSHNGTNWDHRTITLYWFSNLEGITITADGKMYLLDVDDSSVENQSSHIHLANIDDGTTKAIYHVEGQVLSGISWDQANGIMWATMKSLRRISKLNPFVGVE